MRFSQAWAKLATENQIFKVASAVLACAVIILAISTAKLSLRGAMLIERADTLHLLHSGESEPSENELRDFITHALEQRFNTDTEIADGWLAPDQEVQKSEEQKDLKGNNIRQHIIVKDIQFEKSLIKANMARIFFVGDVISGINYPVSVGLKSKSRSSNNLYGLILTHVEPIKKQEGKK